MAEKPRERGEASCTLRERERADVHAAKQNRAVLHVPEGGDEAGDGGLAAAAAATKQGNYGCIWLFSVIW